MCRSTDNTGLIVGGSRRQEGTIPLAEGINIAAENRDGNLSIETRHDRGVQT